jgi:hypothetical protein
LKDKASGFLAGNESQDSEKEARQMGHTDTTHTRTYIIPVATDLVGITASIDVSDKILLNHFSTLAFRLRIRMYDTQNNDNNNLQQR